jgi:hypothetical protein
MQTFRERAFARQTEAARLSLLVNALKAKTRPVGAAHVDDAIAIDA